MILRDSLLTRQAGSVPSLQSLSRDAVLLILSTNNTQERLVTPLVDRLEGEITRRALLLAPHSERRKIYFQLSSSHQGSLLRTGPATCASLFSRHLAIRHVRLCGVELFIF